jgi:hypothetical protein
MSLSLCRRTARQPLGSSASVMSAFRLGIDKPNIRSLVYYQAPGSPEQNMQETGRDGRQADSWCGCYPTA